MPPIGPPTGLEVDTIRLDGYPAEERLDRFRKHLVQSGPATHAGGEPISSPDTEPAARRLRSTYDRRQRMNRLMKRRPRDIAPHGLADLRGSFRTRDASA